MTCAYPHFWYLTQVTKIKISKNVMCSLGKHMYVLLITGQCIISTIVLYFGLHAKGLSYRLCTIIQKLKSCLCNTHIDSLHSNYVFAGKALKCSILVAICSIQLDLVLKKVATLFWLIQRLFMANCEREIYSQINYFSVNSSSYMSIKLFVVNR